MAVPQWRLGGCVGRGAACDDGPAGEQWSLAAALSRLHVVTPRRGPVGAVRRRGGATVKRRAQTAEALFEEWRRTGDPAARAALIEHALPLARSLAARYRYTRQPRDDLEQVASLALVKAVDGFDPERGASFAAYAVPTILGELKRHMRDATWAVRVPRELQERVLAVERALAARTGRVPTAQELATEAGLSTEAVLDALTARGAHDALPLDPTDTSDVDAPVERSPAALAEYGDFRDAIDDRLAVENALRRLRERERTILRLRFIDGLTQTEIAAHVGLSQMYVSRLLRATLERLRAEIT
jgi:RNA polymerase sigma-B factor